jgi:hypothetical protein
MEGSCSFCDLATARAPLATRGDPLRVCDACVRVIISIAGDDPRGIAGLIWPARSVAPSKDSRPVQLSETEAMLERFKADVYAQISVEDAEAHINLAIAYREMGLLADAVIEAVIALKADIHGTHAREALQMLLTRPLLLPHGRTVLRDHIHSRGTLH